MAKKAKRSAPKAGKPLTDAEKSKIDERIIRSGGTPMLKIPPDALPPELRKRFDAIKAGVPKKKKK